MSEPATCPYCGLSPASGEQARAGAGARAVESLHREIERLREIAEGRAASAERQHIEELSREVRQLRETVARLRGAAAPILNRR